MSGMLWELFVVGLLFYGLVLTGLAAVMSRRWTARLETPDGQDAPIFVTRRTRETALTSGRRTGTNRTTRGQM
jgi:hypothetical protein